MLKNASYPEIDDEEFQRKIYEKREFYINRFPERNELVNYKDIKKYREQICGSNFQLTNQQIFLSNYINPNTPFKGVLIFHGTGDQVMPFKGANYVNKNAYKSDSLWNKVDLTVKMNESKVVTSNTWTANNYNFIGYIVNSNNLKLKNVNKVGTDYISIIYTSSTNDMVLNYIVIAEQNHCWSGHKNSGPDSSESNNFYLDATYLITKFFNIGNDYIPTISTIPANFVYSK